MRRFFMSAAVSLGLAFILAACGSPAVTGGPAPAAATSAKAANAAVPTSAATTAPTAAPTSRPTLSPTTAPTAAPTSRPTIAAATVSAAATRSPAGTPVGDLDHVVITLERGPCFGACPTYKVTLRGTGEVTWEGKRFVKAVGPASAKVSPDAVRALLDEMVAAGYFEMNDKYTKVNATDMPSAVTSVTLSGRAKTIDHYYGDNSAPPALTALEKRIDEVAGAAQWIK